MNQWLKCAVMGAIALTLSACSGGRQQFFDNLDVRVYEQGGQSYIQMTTVFELGNVSLTQVDVAVKDPATQQPVGNVNFEQLPSTQGQLILNVNASLLAHADATLGTSLPNGRAIPLALDLEPGESFGVPFLEASRVYLGGSLKGTIFAGVALGIKGLDQVMHRLNTAANVFFSFRPTDNLLGVGGIYGSPNPNENGVAVFAKYTRDGGMWSEETDEMLDNDFYKLDRETQKGIMDFFYGQPRTIEIY